MVNDKNLGRILFWMIRKKRTFPKEEIKAFKMSLLRRRNIFYVIDYWRFWQLMKIDIQTFLKGLEQKFRA